MTVPTPEITPLPTAMTAAAFVGIAWYLCAELNVRLLVLSTRRSLYFWACLLCSWGIIIHMLFILLDDFKLWASYGAIVIIHLTWFTFVVSQSIVLYSRLNLVLPIAKEKVSNYILYMIITTSVCFGLSTVILGLCARHPSMAQRLGNANLIWDRIQLAAFFIQETIIGLLYIRETASHLKNRSLLGTDRRTTRRVLHHLIWINVFIICLDCSLIGLCYAGFFFLQGFYKAAVYAVKLRIEFTILNQLRSTLPNQYDTSYEHGYAFSENRPTPRLQQGIGPQGSQDSDVESVGTSHGQQRGREIRVQKNVMVTTEDGIRHHTTVRL